MAREQPSLTGELLSERYELLEHLGEGGHGACHGASAYYRALDRQSDAIVRVRLLALANAAVPVEQLVEGAERLARLHHPHIVPINDVGIHRQSLYLVSPLYARQTLRSILKQEGSLVEERIRRWGLQLANALRHAHEAGIVHGNLSPDSVFIESSNAAQGHVLLTDFAIPSKGASETSRGGFVGKPEYLSPEEIRGEAVTMQSDLYALGVVLYELAAGVPPFRPENRSAEAVMDVLVQQTEQAPPAIEELAPHAVVSDDLKELLAQLLEKEPIARLSSMAAVVDWLTPGGHDTHRDDDGLFEDDNAPTESFEPPVFTETKWEAAREQEPDPVQADDPLDREATQIPPADPYWKELAADSVDDASFGTFLDDEGEQGDELLWDDAEQPSMGAFDGEESTAEADNPNFAQEASGTEDSSGRTRFASLVKQKEPDADTPTRSKLPFIIGGVVAVLLLWALIGSGQDDTATEPRQLAAEHSASDGEPSEDKPSAALPAPEEQESAPMRAESEESAPLPARSAPTKIGIVDLQQVLLQSTAGAQLEQGYREIYAEAKTAPNPKENLARLTEVNTRVVSQMLVELRKVIHDYGTQERYAIILSEEGEIATAPYVDESLEDPVGVLTSTSNRVNLNAEILAEYNELYETAAE
ncbi:MAG: protein kinase [Bdellovibrionales bacterium]|nr:protein kinase [Bdellovibrionales bacterium]